MVGSETFLVDVRMGQDGRRFQRIITVDRDPVRQAIAQLEALGHTITLEKLTTMEPGRFLTGHQ